MRYWQCLVLVIVAYQGYTQVPVIRNVQPNYGYPGQVISIQGEGLGNNTEVRFGGVTGQVISRSSQLIEVEVPASATFDNISVLNTANRTASHAPLPYTMSFGGDPGLAASDFPTQHDEPAGSVLFDLCLCDLDGDGLNDMAAANSNDGVANIYLNTSTGVGDIRFTTYNRNIANTLNVSCGDLNGDLRPELIYSVDNSPLLVILENQSTPGTLAFTETTINLPGVGTKRVVIRDVNGDGRPEIIGSDVQFNRQIYILQNNSTGGNLNMDPTPIFLPVSGADNTSALEVIDMNGDNLPDIVVNQFINGATGGFFIALNRGTGGTIQFAPFTRFDLNAPVILRAADLNNDNLPDIVVSQSLNNQISILINETATPGGAVSFGAARTVGTYNRPWGVDLADFDGDGKVDMAIGTLGPSSPPSAPSFVSILRNTGTSPGDVSFQLVNVGVNADNRNVAAGDLDGDGRPDIAVTSSDNNITILRNTKCIVPIIDPEGPLNICTNNPQTQTLRTQKVDRLTYSWTIGGAPVPGATNSSLDVTTAGDYEVTISDIGCNETSAPVNVSIGGTPVFTSPSFDSPLGPVCVGSSPLLTMNGDPAYTYNWRGPLGFSATGISVPVPNFQFANSGTYEVDIIVGGCTRETQSIAVTAILAPEFSISASTTDPVCRGENIALSVSPPGNTDFDYEWFDAGNNLQDTGETFPPSSSGDYFFRAIDNVTGCDPIQSPTVSVTILEPPVVNFDLPAAACLNSTVTFTDNSTLDANATPSYLWDFGDGITSSSPTPVHTYAATGNYSVALTVTYDGTSCEGTSTETLTVQPGLEVNVIAEPAVICEGETVELSTEIEYESYTWDTGENEATITVDAQGNYGVSVTDLNGCQGFGQVSLSAFPSPAVEVTADETTVAPGQQVQLNASGLVSYTWTPAELLDDPNGPSPIATVNVPTTFEVSGVDNNGCPGSGTIQIITGGDLIGQLLDPKNFFSPNPGDNINATWTVDGILEFPQCLVTIYDQTGNVLYEAQPYMNDWDGTTGGRDLPSGVYYYTINCGGEELARTGSITLLR